MLDIEVNQEQLQGIYRGEIGALLVEVLEPEDFIALLENVGGRRLYIPVMSANYRGKYANFLSLKGFQALTDCFGGDHLSFPKIDALSRYRRNKEIIKNLDSLSASKLAKQYSLTERRVRQIRQQAREV